MSKLADVAKTTQLLSLAAMEEASRVGQRTGDIDHLFLALVISDQLAGDVLRAGGVTLQSARAAVAAQHAAQLATIGVTVPSPGPGRIVFHETGGYAWSARAVAVFTESTRGGKRGDAAAVLRELLDEPSGMIGEVLRRLGTSTDAVRERLDEAERVIPVEPRSSAPSAAEPAGEWETFVPATPREVWDLLADPVRMPEWDTNIGEVDVDRPHPDDVATGAVWTARLRETRPDGQRMRVKPELRRVRVELLDHEPVSRIAWSFSSPDAPTAATRLVTLSLAPAAGGTRLRIALRWQRRGMRTRGVRGILLRPLYRFLLWMQLTQLGASIARVFR